MNIRKIACCTDFSENSERAFRTALQMSEVNRAKLSVIHIMAPVEIPLFTNQTYKVLPDVPKDFLVLNAEKRMQMSYGARISDSVDYDLIVRTGKISREIINFLKESSTDMLVMGSYGRSGIELSVFGSAVEKVSRKATCPVMIVRGREDRNRRSEKDRRMGEDLTDDFADKRNNIIRRKSIDRRKPVIYCN